MEFPGPACYIAGAMDILAAHAARHPAKPALIEGERVWSWAELIERRNRLGHALVDLGLQPGEHVIVYAANSFEHLLAGAGARAAGLIPVPMNHRLVAEEVAYILDHSDAVAVFVSDQFLPVVEAIRAGAGTDRSRTPPRHPSGRGYRPLPRPPAGDSWARE